MTTAAAAADIGRQSGLGILAARLLFAVQDELYQRLEAAGHRELTRLHGAVIAHLDEAGTRATELARRSGRHKQVIGRIVDELEALGYVERHAEDADRRAKLIVPTKRGREVMRLSDRIVHDIERRVAQTIGESEFENFRKALATVVESLSQGTDQAPKADDPSQPVADRRTTRPKR